jgi:hypothetical protein
MVPLTRDREQGKRLSITGRDQRSTKVPFASDSGSVRAVAVFTGSGGRALLTTRSDHSHTSEGEAGSGSGRSPSEHAPDPPRADAPRRSNPPAAQVEPYASPSTALTAESGR